MSLGHIRMVPAMELRRDQHVAENAVIPVQLRMDVVLVQPLDQCEPGDFLEPVPHPGRGEHEAGGDHELLGEMSARPGQEVQLGI